MLNEYLLDDILKESFTYVTIFLKDQIWTLEHRDPGLLGVTSWFSHSLAVDLRRMS